MLTQEAKKEKIVKTYDYHDKAGNLTYQKLRYEPKRFGFRRPDGNGDYIYDLKGVTRILYHLPEIIGASAQDWLYICEGEKDTDRLRAEGFTATTSGATTSWKPEFAGYFDAKIVCILPHNDIAGGKYAAEIAADLIDHAAEIKVLHLPDLPPAGGDVSDWLDCDGNNKGRLILLTDDAPMVGALETESFINIEPKEIEYLVENKIPLGALSILAGDPGSGKSYLSLYMAATISTGGTWPGCTNPTPLGSTLLIGDEDDSAKVIVPRLIAHGANLRKIQRIVLDPDSYFSIKTDLPRLEKTMQGIPDLKLVVIDPITGFMDSVKQNNNAEVRRVLAPVNQLADKYNITVVGIIHYNKKQGDAFMYRASGGLQFIAMSRSAWGIVLDKEDNETRMLLPIKSNYCIDPTGLKFRIIDGQCQFESEPFYGSIDDSGEKTESRIDKAAEWLRQRLEAGAVLQTTLFNEAEKVGFSAGLIYRTKNNTNIIKCTKEGFGAEGRWLWSLSDD